MARQLPFKRRRGLSEEPAPDPDAESDWVSGAPPETSRSEPRTPPTAPAHSPASGSESDVEAPVAPPTAKTIKPATSATNRPATEPVKKPAAKPVKKPASTPSEPEEKAEPVVGRTPVRPTRPVAETVTRTVAQASAAAPTERSAGVTVEGIAPAGGTGATVTAVSAEPRDEVADPASDARPPNAPTSVGGRLRRGVLDSTPVLLLQAAHPKQAVLFALAMAGAALAAGRPAREVVVVGATVLVGQSVLGWHNDLVDRARDARHETRGKPIAEGRLDPGAAWYAVVVAVLLLVPLSITTGVTAGTVYLVSLVIGLLGNVLLREGVFSFLPWAASFALLPSYLALGGWGGGAEGDPAQPAMTAAAAVLGVGVHLVRSVWGLVPDETDGWSYLPLRLGRRIGATRLLVVGVVVVTLAVGAITYVGLTLGLRQ